MSAFVLLSMARSLRTCLFSSDAAQWWPGLLGWTGPAGHGLDRGGVGTSKFVPGGTPMGVGCRPRTGVVDLFSNDAVFH
jgi:hypothetical protein